MERLTKTGRPMVWGKGHSGEHWLEPCEMSYRDMGEVLRRLAEYEDTGLEPQEIDALKLYTMGAAVAAIKEFDGVSICRLQELAKAEKEGRLVLVPRPGDVLYETDPAHGVVKHTVTDVYWGANTSAVDDNGQTWADYYTNEDIETAHTTREAAEAVLAAGSIMEGFPCE